MAKRRDSIRTRYRRPLYSRLLTFTKLPLLWFLVLFATVLALVFWQWDAIVFYIIDTVSLVWGLFGRGLIIIAVSTVALTIALYEKGVKSVARHWYRWLGFFMLMTSLWGILGWAELGGSIGADIGGYPEEMGHFPILVLFILGIILLIPVTLFHMLEGIVSFIAGSSRKVKIVLLILCLIAVITGLVFWQSDAIAEAGTSAVRSIWDTFGWGLPLIALAAFIAIMALLRQQISSFIESSRRHSWNKWLGGLVLVFAFWGFLGICSLGGAIGLWIVGEFAPFYIKILWVAGLFLLGTILIAPRLLLGWFIPWLREPVFHDDGATTHILLPQVPPPTNKGKAVFPLRRPPIIGVSGTPSPSARKYGSIPEPPFPSGPTLIPGRVPTTAKVEVPAPETQPGYTPSDLKQVAQEVWKKYGESPDLVMENGWKLPPVGLLDEIPEVALSEEDNLKRAGKIEEALMSYGVETKVVQINVGPTVTQFGIEPGWDHKYHEVKEKDKNGNIITRTEEVSRIRVKVDRITSLANDLALALAASSIRIEAPVPGKSVVGIEVPNTISGIVSLRSVIESSSFQKLGAKSKLTIALGKGAGGEAISADLTKMPHLLIAGATGSGKTVCLNAVICCILLHNTPVDVRFILVDPKRVELTPFNGIPHMAAPVIVDAEKAVGVLRWLSQEMDSRYKKMAFAGVRNIDGYNKNRTGSDKIPYLILVIDELADLMMAGFEEVERTLCRLAQLARATGIHLVVATQRPSVDVITGLIKANFPTRISFAVTSQVDSRTILDMVGAEKLLGKGDMLYMPTDAAKPKRLQGCFVSDPEIERLVYFWGRQKSPSTVPLNIEDLTAPAFGGKTAAPSDPLYEAARKLAEEHSNISASYLQRQLHIGYNRAARLFEQLQQEGAGNLDTGERTGESDDPNHDGGAEVPRE